MPITESLPERYTLSGRIQEFPTEESKKIVEMFTDAPSIEKAFGEALGKVESINNTDGLRITFESQEVVHMRPSGNAPEFRCYNEAGTLKRVEEIQQSSMNILLKLKDEV